MALSRVPNASLGCTLSRLIPERGPRWTSTTPHYSQGISSDGPGRSASSLCRVLSEVDGARPAYGDIVDGLSFDQRCQYFGTLMDRRGVPDRKREPGRRRADDDRS